VSYETFWGLNPRKLEPFQKKRELEVKERAIALDNLAWSVGSYVLDAMAVFLSKTHPTYPEEPRSMNSTPNAPKGEKMTDGARFAAFAAEHNKQMRQRNK
jgi:hypothetical protein